MVIGRKKVIRRRKKVKMPKVEFDMEAIREIKKRKKKTKEKDKRKEVSLDGNKRSS